MADYAVPDETCTRCQKSITRKQRACLFHDEIVCYKCYVDLNRAEREAAAKEAAKWITQDQRDFFTGMGVKMPEKTTRVDAQRAFDAMEQLRHFACGVWLNVTRRHIRECGVSQSALRVWAAQQAFDKPDNADAVIGLLQRYPRSEGFIPHINSNPLCRKIVDSAFLAFCKDTDQMQESNHAGEKCKGSAECPSEIFWETMEEMMRYPT